MERTSQWVVDEHVMAKLMRQFAGAGVGDDRWAWKQQACNHCKCAPLYTKGWLLPTTLSGAAHTAPSAGPGQVQQKQDGW
eukprot:553080-Amphidinium_carterae.1